MPDTLTLMGRPKKPETTSVRVDKRLVRKLEVIAIAKDISLPDLLAGYLTPHVEKDFPKALKSVQDWGMKVEDDDK